MDYSHYFENSIRETKRKLRESVKDDWLIMQAVGSIGELDRAANLLVKRLREWYELYNPEFSKSLADHGKFVELILKRGKSELLKEVKVRKEDSMGADFSEENLKPIMDLARAISELYKLRASHEKHLEQLMNETAPNVAAVAGHLTGAKLIALAGSLKGLAEMPASKIQVLGAERAMFRHLKDKRSRPPKYGVLHEHPLISAARKQDHGKVARGLADKTAIASRVDFFKGKFLGDKLRQGLERKFK